MTGLSDQNRALMERVFPGWSPATRAVVFDHENVDRLLDAARQEGAKVEKERASTLLEAAWEAVEQLGVTDCTAESILVPAILKADGDPAYAAERIAEMQENFK